jgi:hypothetical protein
VGVTEQTRVRVANVGRAPLTVTDVVYTTDDGELSLGTHDPLPWTLQAGDYRDLDVTYVPDDGSPDRGTVRVSTIEVPAREAVQEGTGKAFEGFSTGWYVYDDGVAHETTSNPAYTVDQHGDEDLYWYEPSGAHGMTDSTDVAGDFATLRRYVVDAAGPPSSPPSPSTTTPAAPSRPSSTRRSRTSSAISTWTPPRTRPATRSASGPRTTGSA